MKTTTYFYLDGIKLPVSKCKRPSFKFHRGRTWDRGSIYIDDVKYDAHLDTTWGQCIYFQFGEELQWYRVNMWSKMEAHFKGNEYTIDPFRECYIITKKSKPFK